jgi:exopolysaccharide biosynthesis polyprenyl glycosylphosphotransferase
VIDPDAAETSSSRGAVESEAKEVAAQFGARVGGEAVAEAMPRPWGRQPSARERRRRTGARLTANLVLWDALVALVALMLSAPLASLLGIADHAPGADPSAGLVLVALFGSPPAVAIAGGYDHRRRIGTSRLVFASRLLIAGMALSWACMLVAAPEERLAGVDRLALLALLLPIGWVVGRFASDHHPGRSAERVLLIGSGEIAARVVEFTRRNPKRGLEVVGRLRPDPGVEDHSGVPCLGGPGDLTTVLEQADIDRVMVTFAPARDSQLVDALRDCVAAGVQVDVVPRFFDLLGPVPRVERLGRLALVEVPARGLTPLDSVSKRAMDVLVSSALLVVLAPLLVAASAAVALGSGRPVIFRQMREGKDGRPFTILKFRTMTADSEPARLPATAGASAGASIDGHKNTASTRITRVGALLRRTSLDELPQLWNVLRGDMSLVGPRPLPLYEAEHLGEWHRYRRDLKPGLTGLWQVSGRSAVSWEERMHLDYTYVAHWSVGLDVRILLGTLPAVLRRDGAV